MDHVAVKNPVRLYAEPLGDLIHKDDWALVAEAADGTRLTIVASRERFREALHGNYLRPLTHAEQIRGMYLRDEVSVDEFERALEREFRRLS